MTEVVDRLDREITATRSFLRRYEEAGDASNAALAQARVHGLLYARSLLVSPDGTCGHARHRWTGQDGKGRNVWVCVYCGEPA